MQHNIGVEWPHIVRLKWEAQHVCSCTNTTSPRVHGLHVILYNILSRWKLEEEVARSEANSGFVARDTRHLQRPRRNSEESGSQFVIDARGAFQK